MIQISRVAATSGNTNDDLCLQVLQKLLSALHAKLSGKENVELPHDGARPDTAFLRKDRIQTKAVNLSPVLHTVRTELYRTSI